MKAYEGMFLFDSAAATEWPNVEKEINRLIDRASGRMIACRRWDERRLAYEIRGRKRGCYVLTYFAAPGDRIAGIERDVQLSDTILRCLILRVDHMTEDEMKSAAEKLAAPSPDSDRPGGRGRRGDYEGDSDRGDFDRRDDGRRGDRRGPRHEPAAEEKESVGGEAEETPQEA